MEFIDIKSSFMGGFDRKEVIAFIEKQEQKSKQSEKILYNEIEALKSEREELAYKAASLESQNNEIKKALEFEQNERQNAINVRDQIDSDFKNYRVNFTRHDNENSDTVEKARRYDMSKQMIADTLLQAQKDANIILEKAKMKSQQLSSQVYANFDNLLNRLNIFKSSFGSISNDIFSVSTEFKQISDLIISISNEASKIDSSISSMNNTSEEKEYINNYKAFDLDAILSNKGIQDEQINNQINTQGNTYSNRYDPAREYYVDNTNVTKENQYVKEEPKDNPYVREVAKENPYIREVPMVREQTARNEVPYVASKYDAYKQYDNTQKPFHNYANENKQAPDVVAPATENKPDSGQMYIPPVSDTPTKKKAVNISDILMKYAK